MNMVKDKKKFDTDLHTLPRRAQALYDEDWEFRDFLAQLDNQVVDQAVQELFKKISAEIDCRKCCNCCKNLSPQLNEADIERLAKGVGMTVSVFTKKYLIEDEDEPEMFLMFSRPCPFLGKDGCMQYELRPEECKRFPNLEEPDFNCRSMGTISDQEICPIVFQVYQELKKKLWTEKQ